MAKGLSQQGLAEAVGCSLRTVQSWEAGEYSPQSKHIRKLSEVLTQEIPHLLGLVENVNSADQGMRLGERLSDEASTIRQRCLEHLNRVLDQYQGNADRQSWVLVELQRKFPVPETSADKPGDVAMSAARTLLHLPPKSEKQGKGEK